ncbi:hypothetical protein I316_02481 [Kwoniella heveanensis BCC8398]|uniref:Uncharacterized protein n=1 Tax=Kwoniella heveanensis BCC8398 TaxID=1296120 RepID=A0A1B9GYA1_9TREE|nr:hypothetical protein I316_02481 [Kwoniella heveanensis BCC8398]
MLVVPKAPAPEELSALTDTPNLPLSIIRAAQSAVIKGSGETGIVGNARKVLRAREILKKSRGLVDVTKLVEEWLKIWVGDEALKEVEVNQTIEVKSGRKSVTFYDNAKANGATVAELGKEDGDDTPDLAGSQDIPARTVVWLCPSCKHPI